MGSVFTRERAVAKLPGPKSYEPLTLRQAQKLVEKNLVNVSWEPVNSSYYSWIYPLGEELFYENYLEVIETLLAGGADVNRCEVLKDGSVLTGLDLNLITYLGHRADVLPTWKKSKIERIVYGLNLTNLLLDYGADISLCEYGHWILIEILETRDIKTINKFIACGAQFDLGYYIWNPERGNLCCIEKLILQSCENIKPSGYYYILFLSEVENTNLICVSIEK